MTRFKNVHNMFEPCNSLKIVTALYLDPYQQVDSVGCRTQQPALACIDVFQHVLHRLSWNSKIQLCCRNKPWFWASYGPKLRIMRPWAVTSWAVWDWWEDHCCNNYEVLSSSLLIRIWDENLASLQGTLTLMSTSSKLDHQHSSRLAEQEILLSIAYSQY